MAKPKRQTERKPAEVRSGGTVLKVENSGLEVWIYDEANREAIRAPEGADEGAGGMPPQFEKRTGQGLVVGYSLHQDDDLHVAVHVGRAFTGKELSIARWLEPQRAFLRVPSGRLCVESNDASRIGAEEPNRTGGVAMVPPGDYRLTLYRIDFEALERERLTWKGPDEIVLLTPGGKKKDAAHDLLPFQPRRDTTWMGQYRIQGRKADALVWFSDYWDTCFVNLDSAASKALGLTPGAYLRIHAPKAGITLLSVFGTSWDEAKKCPPPADLDLSEYGYAAFSPMANWDGAEALFCRRDPAKTRVEIEHHNTWMPATVEVLDARPLDLPPNGRSSGPTRLADKRYFDPSFLGMVLSDVLRIDDMGDLPLPKAIDHLDRRLAKTGLKPCGDFAWTERSGPTILELSGRFYTGLPDTFAAIAAMEGSFQLVFVSEMDDQTWVVTGLADELDGRVASTGPDGIPRPHPRIRLQNLDEPLSNIFTAHKAAVKQSKGAAVPAPQRLENVTSTWERFLSLALA